MLPVVFLKDYQDTREVTCMNVTYAHINAYVRGVHYLEN
jgi:hypothetical protein